MFNDTSAQHFGGNNFGGGGFMPASPAPGAGAMQTTPASSRRPDYDSQCLLPLSIKQILTMEEPKHDQTFRIDGKEVYHVTIMGWVEEMDVQTTHTTFNIRDDSGMIPVKMWSTDADPQRAQHIAQIQLRQWVRVIGRIQSFQQQYNLTGFNIRPVEDHNEITFHLLEIIHAHLVNTSKPAQPSFDGDVTMADSMRRGGMSHMGGMGMGMGGPGMGMNVNMGGMGQPGMNIAGEQGFGGQDHMDPNLGHTHNLVLNMMKDPRYAGIQEGVHVDQIFNAFPHIDRNKIRQGIEELSNEGLVYSTVDEEHFKATGN